MAKNITDSLFETRDDRKRKLSSLNYLSDEIGTYITVEVMSDQYT